MQHQESSASVLNAEQFCGSCAALMNFVSLQQICLLRLKGQLKFGPISYTEFFSNFVNDHVQIFYLQE